MSIDVIMPQMGESIAEGTIVKWLKKVGDTVERDEPLFEISTDKVEAEIPSPGDGVLSEILVQEGTTVEVNTVVAKIGAAGEAKADAAPAAPAATPAAAPAAAPAPAPAAQQPAAPAQPRPHGRKRRPLRPRPLRARRPLRQLRLQRPRNASPSRRPRPTTRIQRPRAPKRRPPRMNPPTTCAAAARHRSCGAWRASRGST